MAGFAPLVIDREPNCHSLALIQTAGSRHMNPQIECL